MKIINNILKCCFSLLNTFKEISLHLTIWPKTLRATEFQSTTLNYLIGWYVSPTACICPLLNIYLSLTRATEPVLKLYSPSLRIDFLWIYALPSVLCHLPSYFTTPSNKIDQFCMLADTCIHDTIPICGRMGDEKRTFLDLCDLLEYACDSNQVFTHVDDMEGCPTPRPVA